MRSVLTCRFNAMYSIGLMHTDILTANVGTMESIGPIALKQTNDL